MRRFEWALAAGWVSLSFFLTTVTKGATPYLILLLAVVATLYLLIARNGPILTDLPARLFWGSVATLAALFAITAQAPGDMLFVFNFSMFILFPALYTIFARVADARATTVIALCALVGSLIVFADVAIDLVSRGGERVSAPNRESNTATLLGFLTLIGLALPGGRWRLVFLLGPVLGIASTLITGSRGPILAWPALTLLAVYFLVPRRLVLPVLAGAVLLGAGVMAIFAGSRSATIVAIIQQFLSTGTVSDSTTGMRLDLWRAGLGAFFESPLVGHGWARLQAAAAGYMPETASGYVRGLQQLHNDIVNFAVTGGVIGVLVYLTIIATPAISAFRSAADSQKRARIFGALLLGADYFFCGLTDLTIGFEFRSAQFVVIAAVLLGLCRDTPLARRTG